MEPERKTRSTTRRSGFDAHTFLGSAGKAREIVDYGRSETLYSQGEAGDSLFYIQAGAVKLSVVSKLGREAIVSMLGPGDFCGESGLAGQSVRAATATAMTPSTALAIGKDEMIRALHAEHALSDLFIAYMLNRNTRVEEDLLDQLFNTSEKRLARALLLLAGYGTGEKPLRVLPRISRAELADLAETTSARVDFFMNKFKRLGFIEDNGKLKVNRSLLTVVLHD